MCPGNVSPSRGVTARWRCDVSDSTTPPLRVCTKCGQPFPATLEFFHQKKTSKCGLRSACKDCVNAQAAVWRTANLEKVRAYHAAYYTANSEKIAVYQRAWRAANLERKRARFAAYYAANVESCRASNAAYRAANREKIRVAGALYRATYPERKSASNGAWQRANPESIRAKSHRRRALTLAAPGTHTADDIKRIYAEQHGLCAYCGCDLEETDYHVDHVVPLSRPGTSNGPENLVCACPSCNYSKNNQLLEEWERTA